MAGGPGLLAAVVFLTPSGAFVGLAAIVPLAAVGLAARRIRRIRALLGLSTPPPARRLLRIVALLVIPGLLALAATQPALRSKTSARVRTDAEAMFVIDVSRSMAAAKAPGGSTRLQRAQKEAIELRAAIPEVPSGVATLTDRVLPNLLPNADPAVFDDTVQRAVGIEQPPPANQNVIATTLGSLGALGTQNYFPASAKHRLVVVLTDGESRAFDVSQVAHALATRPGVRLVLVHVWQPGEAVYDGTAPESGYHEISSSGATLASLASAAGGSVFGEHSVGAATGVERADLGSGPTIVQGRTERTRTLAPYVILLALLPLAAVARIARVRGPFRALRRRVVAVPSAAAPLRSRRPASAR